LSSLLPDRPPESRQKLAALVPVQGRKAWKELIKLVNDVAIDCAGTNRCHIIVTGVELLLLPDFTP
jgi:hypothetical protein